MFKTELKLTDTVISMDIFEATSNYMLLEYIDHIFSNNYKKNPAVFLNNPVNLYMYRMINNSCHLQFISAVESVYELKKRYPSEYHYLGLDNLICHRNYLSHPSTYDWRDQKMIAFVKAEKHNKENRVKLLWDLKRFLENQLLQLSMASKYKLQLGVYRSQIPVANEIIISCMSTKVDNPKDYEYELELQISSYYHQYASIYNLI